jgi:hypothetical protein
MERKIDIGRRIRKEYPSRYSRYHGYIYAIYSKDFPKFIKIGKTTNPCKRYYDYNNYNPNCSYEYVYITKIFENADNIESKFIHCLYMKGIRPVYQKEWFDISHKDMIVNILEQLTTTKNMDDIMDVLYTKEAMEKQREVQKFIDEFKIELEKSLFGDNHIIS